MTAPTAPTEAEIRALVTTPMEHGPFDWTIGIADEFSEAVTEFGCRLDKLYDVHDMRESEREAMDRIVDEHIDPIRKRAGRQLEAAMIAAGIEFAAECPDVPRATREPVPA
jgi:hypothetical protein